MKPRELTIEEFNALNYLSEQNTPVDILTINSIQILRTPKFIDTFCAITLPSNAVAYVNNVSEKLSKPETITLIEKSQDCYLITDKGKRYVEYYHDYILV